MVNVGDLRQLRDGRLYVVVRLRASPRRSAFEQWVDVCSQDWRGCLMLYTWTVRMCESDLLLYAARNR